MFYKQNTNCTATARGKGRLRFVLLEEIGRPVVHGDVPGEIVREVVRTLTAG